MIRKLALTLILAAMPALAAEMLPTGVKLDAAGRSIPLGNMPLSMAVAPDGEHAVVLLGGWQHQGLEVVDLASGSVTQTIEKNSTFIGLAFSPDGKTLFASGGFDDAVYVYSWSDGKLAGERALSLKTGADEKPGRRYPAGLAVSDDGKFLYVAENVADDVAVIDIAQFAIVQRLPTEHYPYAVAIHDRGVYVSAWGGESVMTFRADDDGRLWPTGRLTVGRHPSALALSSDGSKLYVALASKDQIVVVDTKRRRIARTLSDASPAGPREGSTPNALALSADGSRLYVAEADNNAVAVFNLTTGALTARVPTDWYPLGVAADAKRLLILNGKGAGTGPNPQGPRPDRPVKQDADHYTLALIKGTLRIVPLPLEAPELLTKRVAAANNWKPRVAPKYPPFEHVIYIIKENRTYDQVLGDLKTGDGDPSLLFFPREVSPNHHALAERFGLFDRFFTNAEVSSQGHIWSTAGYVTDYGEKTIPSLYANKRDDIDEGDVDEPAEGFVWTRALEKGISLRVYGEFAVPDETNKRYRSSKHALLSDTSPDYPPFDTSITDQRRADVWIAEFAEHVRTGTMPQLEILHLPNDHTAGGKAGKRTPRAFMADNDLALGRIVEAVSKSPYWKSTVIFVVEDDAQDGADHVDSHRAPFYAISAYNKSGLHHGFANTTDVIAAIGTILGMRPLSKFDHYSRPLAEVFAAEPDLTPYTALDPAVALDELNPSGGAAAQRSEKLDLSAPDRIDDALFNDILWQIIKGNEVPPAAMPR